MPDIKLDDETAWGEWPVQHREVMAKYRATTFPPSLYGPLVWWLRYQQSSRSLVGSSWTRESACMEQQRHAKETPKDRASRMERSTAVVLTACRCGWWFEAETPIFVGSYFNSPLPSMRATAEDVRCPEIVQQALYREAMMQLARPVTTYQQRMQRQQQRRDMGDF